MNEPASTTSNPRDATTAPSKGDWQSRPDTGNESSTGLSGMASKAGESLMETIEEQKTQGTNFVRGVASAVRRSAREFEGDVPQAAQYIRYAADQIDGVADAVPKRDFGQMLADVQSFARQQPLAFLGATVLAGFAAVRFLKTAVPGSNETAEHAGHKAIPRQGSDFPGRQWSPPTSM